MHGTAYPAEALRRGPERGGPAEPLLAAGACLLALVVVWAIASHVPAAQTRDATALYHLTLLDRPAVEDAGRVLLYLLNPVPMALWAVALGSLALARERPREALAAVSVMILAPLCAEILKPLLAHPHDSVGGVYIAAASWPSGHATAATALALAALIVAPSRMRMGIAAAGALFVLAVGAALLILAWHMPSDVIGGILLALFWASLAVAWLRSGLGPLRGRARPGARARS